MSNSDTIKLYGIKNCDTVKKACRWLESNNFDYHFHDLRNDGIERAQIKYWLSQLGWEKVVNKRSTTWKNLDNTLRDSILHSENNDEPIISALLNYPTLIKRPVMEYNGQLQIGFKADQYTATLHNSF